MQSTDQASQRNEGQAWLFLTCQKPSLNLSNQLRGAHPEYWADAKQQVDRGRFMPVLQLGYIGTVYLSLKRHFLLRKALSFPGFLKSFSQQQASTTSSGHAGKV